MRLIQKIYLFKSINQLIKKTRKQIMNNCYFSKNGIKQVDYKDVEILKKFLNPHGRMVARKRTGICANHQKQLASAIKRARIMGFLPFIAR